MHVVDATRPPPVGRRRPGAARSSDSRLARPSPAPFDAFPRADRSCLRSRRPQPRARLEAAAALGPIAASAAATRSAEEGVTLARVPEQHRLLHRWARRAPRRGGSWSRVRSSVSPDGRRFQAWRSIRRPSRRMSATRISPPRYGRRTTAVASHWPREGLSTVHSSGSADVSCDHDARIAASRSASVTAAVASGAGSVGDLPNERAVRLPGRTRTARRSRRPRASHSTRNRSTGAPADDRLDERAADALQPVVRDARRGSVSASSRSAMRSMPMQPDELAVLAPADEEPRELVGSGCSRVGLRERGECLHLGVVGAATEIDESHSVRSTAGQPAVADTASRRPRRSRRTPPWARALPSPHPRHASGPARIRDRSRRRRCAIPSRGWRTGRHRRRRTRAPSTPGNARSPRPCSRRSSPSISSRHSPESTRKSSCSFSPWYMHAGWPGRGRRC